MRILRTWCREQGFPFVSVKKFVLTKLTEKRDYVFDGSRLKVTEEGKAKVYDRNKWRHDYPYTNEDIKSMFDLWHRHLDFLEEGRHWIKVSTRHYYNETAVKIIERRKLEKEPTIRSVDKERFSEMNEAEKDKWAETVGLKEEVKNLIFK